MGNTARELEQPKPVVSVECSEPNGKVVRHVRPARISIERLGFLWEKLREFKVLFNDFVKDDFDAFIHHFIVMVDGEVAPTGLLWDVDDVGIFFLTDIRPGNSAEAHFVFWDRRFNGREELCRAMLNYAFETLELHRISTQVPLYAPHTMRAVEKLGFFWEGRLRGTSLYEGKWFDTNVYSMLEGEPDKCFGKPSGWDRLEGAKDARA